MVTLFTPAVSYDRFNGVMSGVDCTYCRAITVRAVHLGDQVNDLNTIWP